MFQQHLFGGPTTFDATFSGLTRQPLERGAWLDFLPGWVRGTDALLQALLAERPWKQRQRLLWNAWRTEPRLTAPWTLDSGAPLHPLVDDLRRALGQRYGITFDSVGFNLYRDGQDAVAWHRDTIDPAVVDPLVVLVSLGATRRLLIRPFGGGPSRALPLADGDLLVTGGTFQRTWEHTVPRVKQAGARLSLAFRHGLYARGTSPS